MSRLKKLLGLGKKKYAQVPMEKEPKRVTVDAELEVEFKDRRYIPLKYRVDEKTVEMIKKKIESKKPKGYKASNMHVLKFIDRAIRDALND